MNNPAPELPSAPPARLVRGLLACGVTAGVAFVGGTGTAAAAPDRDEVPSYCVTGPFANYVDPLRMCEKSWQAVRESMTLATPTQKSPAVRRAAPKTRRPHAKKRHARTPAPVRSSTALPAPEAAEDTSGGWPIAPALLPWLLVPLAGAVLFSVHRLARTPAVAVAGGPGVPGGAAEATEVTTVYRTALDPFALPPLGLRGPGATEAARVIALAALEVGGDVLMVMPRTDAGLLFGLGEDELADDTFGRLFLPGTLDGALSCLEAAVTGGPGSGPSRLLLVADCEKSADRINSLLTGYPDRVSAVILGDWPYDCADIDEDGRVEAPALAGWLPERLPAMSRTEARDRLMVLLGGRRPN